MKSFVKKSKSAFTFTDFVFILLVVSGVYAGVVYFPYIYKRQELEALVKDYTFRTGRATPDRIRDAVVEDAKKKLDITLHPDDVFVTLDDERSSVKAIWRPVIKIVGGYEFNRVFVVEYNRKQL
ncbi:MAG: hypothetical protein IT286_03530 [Proteobacteria bacterium]|nr:hypothetical protein [Pseudomonadota bacterium]